MLNSNQQLQQLPHPPHSRNDKLEYAKLEYSFIQQNSIRILNKKITKIPHNIDRKIIVTLTTIPSRLKNIEQTIKSIKNQTIDVDEIVLSLPKVSVREPSTNDPYNIDEVFLKLLKTYNVTLLRCDKDYGPATKLLGLLTREINNNTPETEPLIITIDDDKIYHNNTIEYLLTGWKRNQNCAIGRVGSNIILEPKLKEIIYKGCVIKKDMNIEILFGTSCILYRPSFFNKNIFDFKKQYIDFNDTAAFFIDDIYISKYLELNNIQRKLIQFDNNEITSFYKSKIKIDLDSDNRMINPLVNINHKNPNYTIDLILYFNNLIKKTK